MAPIGDCVRPLSVDCCVEGLVTIIKDTGNQGSRGMSPRKLPALEKDSLKIPMQAHRTLCALSAENGCICGCWSDGNAHC